jgi:CDP-2,3-bis-(O-geranylgeranyl)-sn-glycerol synthase
MHPVAIAQMIVLLAVANGAPVMAKAILGDRFAHPLDGGHKFLDGRPLFGASKTVRGVLVSLVATSLCAPLVGVRAELGALIAGVAIAGDLASSFLKRRLGLTPSSRATGLDQIPESLLPALASVSALALSAADIAVTVGIFFVGEVLASRILYRLHVRDRPY